MLETKCNVALAKSSLCFLSVKKERGGQKVEDNEPSFPVRNDSHHCAKLKINKSSDIPKALGIRSKTDRQGRHRVIGEKSEEGKLDGKK